MCGPTRLAVSLECLLGNAPATLNRITGSIHMHLKHSGFGVQRFAHWPCGLWTTDHSAEPQQSFDFPRVAVSTFYHLPSEICSLFSPFKLLSLSLEEIGRQPRDQANHLYDISPLLSFFPARNFLPSTLLSLCLPAIRAQHHLWPRITELNQQHFSTELGGSLFSSTM